MIRPAAVFGLSPTPLAHSALCGGTRSGPADHCPRAGNHPGIAV